MGCCCLLIALAEKGLAAAALNRKAGWRARRTADERAVALGLATRMQRATDAMAVVRRDEGSWGVRGGKKETKRKMSEEQVARRDNEALPSRKCDDSCGCREADWFSAGIVPIVVR